MVSLTLLYSALVPAPAVAPVFTDSLFEPAIPSYSAPVVRKESVKKVDLSSFLDRVVELTNVEREKAGVQPLSLNTKLSSAASWMAEDMAKNDYFDHVDRNGRRVGDRAFACGYRGWTSIGENMAAGHETPEAVVNEWMSSPSHRRNLLKPEYTEIGVGFAENTGSTYGKYWVQAFGAQPSYVAMRYR